MKRTTAKQRLTNSLKTMLAAAALAITATGAQAQFGYNLGQRLGGPLIAADFSGYGGYGGYGYGGNAYTNGYAGMNANTGYNLPRPIIFSGNGVDSTFGSQLTTNLNTNNSFGIVNTTGANQLINDPLFGFQQPRTVIDPFTGLAVQQGFNASSNQFANGQYINGNAYNQALYNQYLVNLGLAANTTAAANARQIIYTPVPVQSMGVMNQNMVTSALGQSNGLIRSNGVATNSSGQYFTSIPLPSDGTKIPFSSTGIVNGNPNGQYFTNIPMPSDGTKVPLGYNGTVYGGPRQIPGYTPGIHWVTGSGFGIQSSMRSIHR
jgi:hypothetical protein